MDGDSAELFIFETRVGSLGAWTIRATPGALTFKAEGRIPVYWLSAGADIARVLCLTRGSDRRPFTPALPIEIEGSISEMDGGHIVLTNVKRTAQNDLS